MNDHDVVIVGAGPAGLACAADLLAAGRTCVVLEASDGVGGRVRSDQVDGFTLDRGFQILLTDYPEVSRRLDLDALAVESFDPGAEVRIGGSFHRVADPLRSPRDIVSSVRAPVGSLLDKARLARLVADVLTHRAPELLRRRDRTTAERLAEAGFSPRMVETFWRPLFAGIQLDPDLDVSARRFDVILRSLARGKTVVPARGMGAITAQLAEALPAGVVRLDTPVADVSSGLVVTEAGERVGARCVVVATDGPRAHALLGTRVPDPGSRPVACGWFTIKGRPHVGRALLLNGEGRGPALNVAVMTEVAPSYAPAGQTLVAAAVPGAEAFSPGLTGRIQEQLAGWFATTTGEWEHLRTDVIAHGQPLQSPPFSPRQRVSLGDGLFVCGDHRDTASLQGAFFSGRRSAQAVLLS